MVGTSFSAADVCSDSGMNFLLSGPAGVFVLSLMQLFLIDVRLGFGHAWTHALHILFP